MKKQHLVVLTGAGISAESGLKTYRGNDGLWEGERVEEVATFDGWLRNKQKVLDFYNLRRKQARDAKPNDAHKALAELEKIFEVSIITQNVDDLHERGGSTQVLHLHGMLESARSTQDENLTYQLDGIKNINLGDKCELGSQLRPDIVWFGEPVPKMEEAYDICLKANLLLVVGTSLVVYPAASLLGVPSANVARVLVDPEEALSASQKVDAHLVTSATQGVRKLVDFWLDKGELSIPIF